MIRRPTALLAALAGGCYPWIDGGWDAYWLPEEVGVVGVGVHEEPVGGYWTDTSSSAYAWWGRLSEASSSASALEFLSPAGLGCAATSRDLERDPGRFTPLDTDQVVLSGPQELVLDYQADDRVFWAELEQLEVGSYALESFEDRHAGRFQVDPFLYLPRAAVIEGPELAGETVAMGNLSDLYFRWNPVEALADYVVVEAWLATTGDYGYHAYEYATCAVLWSDGELEIPPSTWEDRSQADAVYLFVGTAAETFSRVGQRDFSSLTMADTPQPGNMPMDP